jgi:hypothetical protein
MYIAFSALNQKNKPTKQRKESKLVIRYKAYQTTCEKYKHEIVAIQKYMPNWQPAFNY